MTTTMMTTMNPIDGHPLNVRLRRMTAIPTITKGFRCAFASLTHTCPHLSAHANSDMGIPPSIPLAYSFLASRVLGI